MSDALRADLIDKLVDCVFRLRELDALILGRERDEHDSAGVEETLALLLEAYVRQHTATQQALVWRASTEVSELAYDLCDAAAAESVGLL